MGDAAYVKFKRAFAVVREINPDTTKCGPDWVTTEFAASPTAAALRCPAFAPGGA